MRSLLLALLMLCAMPVLAQADKAQAKARRQLDRGKVYAALRTCDKHLRKDRPAAWLVLRAEGQNRIAHYDKGLHDAREAWTVAGADMELRAAIALQAGIAHLRQDALDSAELWLERALYGGATSDALHQLGLLAGQRDDHHLALERFNTALGQRPDRYTTLRERGSAHARLGDTASARRDLEHALQLAPRDPVNWNSRGFELHARQGHWAQAVKDYDRAIKLDPNYAYVFNNRGWAYWRMGQRDRARRDIRLAERKNPGNPFVYRNLGMMALEEGDTLKACQHLRHALSLGFMARHGIEVNDVVDQHCGGHRAPPSAPTPTPTNAPRRSDAPVRSNAP